MKTLLTVPASALFLCLFPLGAQALPAPDVPALTADRAAIERVYYERRVGTKPPFEEAVPGAQIQQLVQADARKEAVLQRVYGLAVDPALVRAEVRRIQAALAPETLAAIQRALGNDPGRFARSMARPVVVERLLHQCFDADAKLHAPQRQALDALRAQMLTTKTDDNPAEAPPAQDPEAGNVPSAYMDEIAWVLTRRAPDRDAPRKYYFEDLPGKLQNDLRAQLRQPGDVSAVIETPGSFAFYLAREKTADQLVVAVFSLPKRPYPEWLAAQPE